MNFGAKIRLGLAAKLAVCVIASTAAFFALFGFINLRMERAQLAQTWWSSPPTRITDVILRSTRYEMLHNDRDALYNIIQELGSEPGIRRIRIFNKDGRITLSTHAGETGKVVNKTAEGCVLCHARRPRSKSSPQRPRARIHRERRARCWA